MQEKQKIAIRDLSLEDLTEKIIALGDKKFRANQIHEWLWKKSAVSFEEMSNLSKELRGKLEEEFEILPLQIDMEQKSSDGTVKCRFKLHDGHFVEGVLIPTKHRMTACVSSQVGCNLGCTFCATGFIKTKRNLQPHEIYDQVVVESKSTNADVKTNPNTKITTIGGKITYSMTPELVEKLTIKSAEIRTKIIEGQI